MPENKKNSTAQIVMFPGSFDPFHLGHQSIIQKACQIFEKVIVVVTNNPEKTHTASLDERLNMTTSALRHLPQVTVVKNDILTTASFALKNQVKAIIRGARNVEDFAYELELAAINKELAPNIETIIILPDLSHVNYASRRLRQLGPKE